MRYVEEIKEKGDGSVRDGVLNGTDNGYFHRRFRRPPTSTSSASTQARRPSLGVNAYEIKEDTSIDTQWVEETTRERQLDQLKRVKDERVDH